MLTRVTHSRSLALLWRCAIFCSLQQTPRMNGWCLIGLCSEVLTQPFLYEFPVVPGTAVVMGRPQMVNTFSKHRIVWNSVKNTPLLFSAKHAFGQVVFFLALRRADGEVWFTPKLCTARVCADLRPVSARPWTRFHEQCVLTELPGADWIFILSVATEDSRCFDRLLHDCAAVAARHLHLETTSICWAQDRHLMYWRRWTLRRSSASLVELSAALNENYSQSGGTKEIQGFGCPSGFNQVEVEATSNQPDAA